MPIWGEEESIGTHEEEEEKLALKHAKKLQIEKDRRQRPITPGPGTHTVPPMFGGRIEDKFGRCENKPSVTVRQAPAFSMEGRREDHRTHKKVGVGPGLYDPKQETLQKRPRACFFGSAPRPLSTHVVVKHTAAPMAMAVEEDPRYARSPRYGFGGAGANRPKFALSAKRERGGCRTPGPGQHFPKESASSTSSSDPTYSFGRRGASAVPPDSKDIQAPGPSTYAVENCEACTTPATPRCAFGRSPRMSLYEKGKSTPGPETYNLRNADSVRMKSPSAPKWSMTGRAAKHSFLEGHTF